MRTERRWKWLSGGLAVLLGSALAMPSAVAHTSESLHHMVEDVLDTTTSMQRDTDAIEQKVSALPDHPASKRDITENNALLLAAVGKRGFTEVHIDGSGSPCRMVVPFAPAGTARLATISIKAPHGESIVKVGWHREGELRDHTKTHHLEVGSREAVTFVQTASEGHGIYICAYLPGYRVSAQWDDRPSVHLVE